MTTKKNYKELENLKEKGKKKYQQRLIEEKEAEKLIREMSLEDEIEYDPVKLQLDKDGV
jgi:hypothetical protein